ncbi:HipA family kinase [Apilactobacillus xinyiensis]|uniref:HipA family kinase n=1 Tax=Apilactobacillus xinyiensis TaxID=2841032 RepID=UPI001C7DD6AC|nr:HipA family kinase [Apilactobacillus xinyiensis]
MILPKVKNVISNLKSGYTHPFIVKCDNSDNTSELFVLKAINKDICGKALFNELVCGRLAEQLGMSIPRFQIVNLTNDIILNTPEMQQLDFIAGPCFASLYRKGRGMSQTYVKISKNKNRLPEIILFDQIILNIDRCKRTDNILFDSKTKSFFLIDHTEAFDIAQIWNIEELKHRMNKTPPYLTSELKGECYDNISCLVKGMNDFRRFKEAAKKINYNDLIKNIPDEWGVSKEEQEFILIFLKSRFNQIDDIIKELRENIFNNWKGAS